MNTPITCTGLQLYNFGMRVGSVSLGKTFVMHKERAWYCFYDYDSGDYECKLSSKEYELFHSQKISGKLDEPYKEL